MTTLNTLSPEHKSRLWTPRLGFTNALGPFQTEVDQLTTGVYVREGPPLKEDITLATEGKQTADSNQNKTTRSLCLHFSYVVFRSRQLYLHDARILSKLLL